MLLRVIMPGILLAVVGCVATSESKPGKDHDDTVISEQVKKYQEHFERQHLPYIDPLGCGEEATCSLADDFNDDGIVDYVALYEYSGGKRRYGERYIDLVFVYSVPDSSEPVQQVFTHMGKIDAKRRTSISLEVQSPGVLLLPVGRLLELERKGVNLIPTDGQLSPFLPTFYWNGEKFYSIVKESD